MDNVAFQDQIDDNFCFGCGPANQHGLRIKSYWNGPRESICIYQPEYYQTAGPRKLLNGGIIATLIDCHCVCTAIAQAYLDQGRPLGSPPVLWYATGTLTVKYLRPVPIDTPVLLKARIVEAGEKKTLVNCSLSSNGKECAIGDVVAIRVPWSWRETQ